MKPATVTLLALALAACGGGKEQSYPDALRLVCESPVGVPEGADRATRALAAVDAKVTNPRARAFMGELAASEHKADALRAAAFEAGLARCTLADVWVARGLIPTVP